MSEPSTSAESSTVAKHAGPDEQPLPEKLKLLTSDGKIIEMDEKLVRECTALMDSFSFSSTSPEEIAEMEFTVAVAEDALVNMLKFASLVGYDGNYVEPKNYEDFERVDDDHPAMEFLNDLSSPEAEALVNAICFFNISRLCDYVCNFILSRMDGEDTHGIRAMLELPDDYTEEQEKEICKKHEREP